MSVNMCLAANGGTLGDSANEADRDDNFNVASHTYEYNNSGGPLIDVSESASITFPASKISYIKWRHSGNASDGGGATYASLYVQIGGSWIEVATDNQSGIGSTDTGEATVNPTGSWTASSLVTGIKSYHRVVNSYGVRRSYLYEIQAWGNPAGTGSFGQII